MKYVYITSKQLGGGEVSVQGNTADGGLVFGFRTRDNLWWRSKARSYTPTSYIPVFQANKPARVLA